MKPRIGVYLSERTAARLAAAAKRPGATKSALVEAALDRFLGSEDDVDQPASVTQQLAAMSRQLQYLGRDLRTVNETVAHHARFHLAVTPMLSAAAQPGACALGAERFEEFAAQVERRVDLGTSLIRETLDRRGAARRGAARRENSGEGRASTQPAVQEADLQTSVSAVLPEPAAAAREGGSLLNFPGRAGLPLH